VAEGVGCRPEEVLVCSTGLIGIPFPMAAVERGVGPLLVARRPGGGDDAALALLTTDLGPKQARREGDGFTLAGMAKGAAMLAPNMATMLALLTTDAAAAPAELAASLRAAVAGSFNALSIDGATSTNDTVIALAGGGDAAPWSEFPALMADVCAELATMMADGAEGATKRARVRVTGAASVDDARRAARKVAESQLVQCSLYGADPYWGRIVSELGSSGAAFDPDRVSIFYGSVEVCRRGVASDHDPLAAKAALSGRNVEITADLGLGDAEASVLTNDLTPGYIAENMRTS
jgi:glutamate N-acetyltransferase/amino-acid N-acetyltransferase